MELDTGSGVSAAPLKRFWKKNSGEKKFHPFVKLKTVTEEIFKVFCYVDVSVTYENEQEI